jgi:DNA polymerase/3'-5' exonuclease PolX
MSMIDSSHIARLLKEFGLRTMLYGGNPYRAKAYLRAAERVALLTEPIETLIAQNRLREIPGVGEAIAAVIKTLTETGSHPSLEKIRADSVLEGSPTHSSRGGVAIVCGSKLKKLETGIEGNQDCGRPSSRL